MLLIDKQCHSQIGISLFPEMVRHELDFVTDHDSLLFYTTLHIQDIYCVTNYLFKILSSNYGRTFFNKRHIHNKDID